MAPPRGARLRSRPPLSHLPHNTLRQLGSSHRRAGAATMRAADSPTCVRMRSSTSRSLMTAMKRIGRSHRHELQRFNDAVGLATPTGDRPSKRYAPFGQFAHPLAHHHQPRRVAQQSRAPPQFPRAPPSSPRAPPSSPRAPAPLPRHPHHSHALHRHYRALSTARTASKPRCSTSRDRPCARDSISTPASPDGTSSASHTAPTQRLSG